MPDRSFTSKDRPTLRSDRFDSGTPPTVRSWTRSGARKTIITSEAKKEYYPPVYAPSGTIGNLKFALRYKPIDLSVYDALFKVLDAALLEEWIRQEPTGGYVRRAWVSI
jgi:hypothetical protein